MFITTPDDEIVLPLVWWPGFRSLLQPIIELAFDLPDPHGDSDDVIDLAGVIVVLRVVRARPAPAGSINT